MNFECPVGGQFGRSVNWLDAWTKGGQRAGVVSKTSGHSHDCEAGWSEGIDITVIVTRASGRHTHSD